LSIFHVSLDSILSKLLVYIVGCIEVITGRTARSANHLRGGFVNHAAGEDTDCSCVELRLTLNDL